MIKEQKGKLFIISGPTGAGKTTVINEVIRRVGNPAKIYKTVTYTTRPPRDKEQNSSDYNFLSLDKFRQLEKEGFFLETNEYNKHWYGSPAEIVGEIEQGKSFVIVVDRDGAKTAHRMVPDAVMIWLTAPNIEAIEYRMKKRGDSIRQMEARLEIAEEEMKNEHKHGYFKYHLVNDNLNSAILELISIVEDELKA